MKFATVVAIALILSACSHGTPSELAAVVLREQLNEVPADFVACVSVDGKDASQDLVAELETSRIQIVLGSECTWVMDVQKGSFHSSSGRKAMLVNVTANLSEDEVAYEARHHGRWAIFLTMQVREDGDGWKVVKVIKHEEA